MMATTEGLAANGVGHDRLRNGETTNGDFAESLARPLQVIVVGGGIASLVASITLRQQGHKVVIYEKSRFANETGAAIHCTPNATSSLRHIGIDPRDGGAVPLVEVRYHGCGMLASLTELTDAYSPDGVKRQTKR